MNFDDLIARSMEELRLKTEAHDGLWHLGEADWSVDQDRGQIVFSTSNGVVATCPVQIIGTYNTDDSTWLWAWDHPSVEPPLTEHAARLREYGEVNNIPDLTTRKLSISEERCWEFTGLAFHLNEAQGAYRGPAGSTLVFMTFGEPQLTGTPKDRDADSNDVAQESPTDFTAEIPEDIRAVIRGFIQALHVWEVAANARCKADSQTEIDAAKESYEELLRQWCVSDVTPQPIAFGDPPKHDLDAEELVSAAVSDGRCRVRTRHSNSTNFVSDYEYHLRFDDGKWLVENLYFVDDEDKYEML